MRDGSSRRGGESCRDDWCLVLDDKYLTTMKTRAEMTNVPYLSTERVDSNSGGEGCSIFYLGVTGEAVLIRKTEVEETQFRVFP